MSKALYGAQIVNLLGVVAGFATPMEVQPIVLHYFARGLGIMDIIPPTW